MKHGTPSGFLVLNDFIRPLTKLHVLETCRTDLPELVPMCTQAWHLLLPVKIVPNGLWVISTCADSS